MVHGDDADSHRRRSFLVVTFGSACVTGVSFWDSKLPIYITDNHQISSESAYTLDCWASWSLVELGVGRYLDRDPWGRPCQNRQGEIAGGYRGIYCIHKGDEKYVQKAFRTAHSAVSANICISCKATASGEMIYTQHGPCAKHRSTILSQEEFVSGLAGIQTYTRVPGFHPSFVQPDWLHILDLALIPEASASALIELVEGNYFGQGNADEKMRRAYIQFVSECKRMKIRTLTFYHTENCIACFQVKSFSGWGGLNIGKDPRQPGSIFMCETWHTLISVSTCADKVCITCMQIIALQMLELCELQPRKHLYAAGPKTYPSLAQKHFNGADPSLKSGGFAYNVSGASWLVN